MRHYIAVAITFSLFAVPWLATHYPSQADTVVKGIHFAGDQLAAVVRHNPRTIAQLQTKYTVTNPKTTPSPIRILLVPGHEPHYGGAEFGKIKERDLTVQLTNELAKLLGAHGKYEIITTRDADSWNPAFARYFDSFWNDIIDWQKSYKAESLREISALKSLPPPPVLHNDAPPKVATRLYGLVKWSNENNVDIALHVHFNDYGGRRGAVGKYNGISIYTPEKLYLNGTTTRAVTEAVFNRLQKYNPISDLPGESTGIIDERELIAIGAYNTADAASMLIEYGYIYEPQFTQPVLRDKAIKDLALQTYLGLEDFLNSTTVLAQDTVILPYTWTTPLVESTVASMDVYAIQTALMNEKLYPPSGRTKNDCPRTGKIGPCTLLAIKSFQTKYGIVEKGVGPKTIAELNRLYSVR
ncbi:MAG: peptidoglycan-binding protein [bacterium]|nr:peptidoglycan-binding protein [bacterium]